MVKTGHIGRKETAALCMMVGTADVFLHYPQQISLMGGSAAWMIPLLSMGIAFVVWWFVGPTLVALQGEGLSGNRSHRARWLVLLFSLLTVGALLIDMSTTMRLFTETVIATVLPRSPISFIAVPLLLVVLYYAYVGIEGLSRVAALLAVPLLSGLAVLLLLNFNWVKFDFLFPFFGRGGVQVALSGLVVTSVFKNILLLTVLGSLLRKGEDVQKAGYWSILMIGLVYTGVTLMLLLTFSADGAQRAPFPLYQLGRLVYAGTFVQRLESAFVFIWVAMALLKLAAELWVMVYLVATACRLPQYRPLVFPIGLIVFGLSFLPGSYTEAMELNTKWMLMWGSVLFHGVPVSLAIWLRLQKPKRGGRHEPERKPA